MARSMLTGIRAAGPPQTASPGIHIHSHHLLRDPRAAPVIMAATESPGFAACLVCLLPGVDSLARASLVCCATNP